MMIYGLVSVPVTETTGAVTSMPSVPSEFHFSIKIPTKHTQLKRIKDIANPNNLHFPNAQLFKVFIVVYPSS